jgi:hypothetical protein
VYDVRGLLAGSLTKEVIGGIIKEGLWAESARKSSNEVNSVG